MNQSPAETTTLIGTAGSAPVAAAAVVIYLVAFITGVPCEFMPHLPSAQSMHGHIIRLCTHLALRIAGEGQVDGCSMRPQIHQALDRFLAQQALEYDWNEKQR